MLERLTAIEGRYDEVTRLMADGDVIADRKQYMVLNKELLRLQPIVDATIIYRGLTEELAEAQRIVNDESDEDLIEMAKEEIEPLEQKLESLEQTIKDLLLPKDPNDDRNTIMEFRGGTGGDEAAIFAGDLFRMYSRYAESKGWKLEILSSSASSGGGFKEVIASVTGEGAYGQLKYESGVHRVQRVPATETQGRIHTSTASVAVLPEADGDVDIEISPSDLNIDVYRSSGPGGQSVNTTDSAVRITHLPTGVVVTCQDERSQIKNRAKAMKVLRSRLLDAKIREQQEGEAADRKLQIGTGERSEKIRTYNFPQSRVTDHRIKLTVHNLTEIMDGALGDVIEALRLAERTKLLEHETESAKR
jgi:peptide chain release factor 1